MQKKKIFITLSFICLISFFSLILINQNFNLTGLAIYSSQPGAEGKDTYIREDFPTMNFGTNTEMQIGKTAAEKNLNALLYFNLSSIPPANTNTSKTNPNFIKN